jgi:hypothetical protein
MSRKKGSKNLKGAEPWKEYGLTRNAYYNRLCKGIPLTQAPGSNRGPKICNEELREYQMEIGQKEYRRIQSSVCYRSKRILDNDLRASGKHYENTPEKLEAIKEKYRNGVTDDIMKEFESKLAKTENPFCP